MYQPGSRRRRPKRCRLAAPPRLRRLVADKLAENWSPETICRMVGAQVAGGHHMWIAHETIYRYLFIQTRGVFKKKLIRHLRHVAQCDAPSLGVQMGSSGDRLLTVFQSVRGQGPFKGTGNWIDCRGGPTPIWTPSIFDDHACSRQTMNPFSIETFPPKRAVSFPESRTGKN